MTELKFLNIGILSWITFLPLIAAAAIQLISSKNAKKIKWIAVLTTAIQALITIILWIKFNNSLTGFNTINSLQFIEKWNWISIPGHSAAGSINIEYFLAVDGLSLPMLLLTSILSFTCMLFTFRSDKSLKVYFTLFLMLNCCITGSFVSMDFFLFFIFSTFILIPVYFLTGFFVVYNRFMVLS